MLYFKYSFLNAGRYKLLQNHKISNGLATFGKVVAYILIWLLVGFLAYSSFQLVLNNRALNNEPTQSVNSEFDRLHSHNIEVRESVKGVRIIQDDPKPVVQELLPNKSVGKEGKENVRIYAATKFFAWWLNDERFLSGCPDFKDWCHISNRTADYTKSDAVVFHNADYSVKILPKVRETTVPWVLFSLESPSNDMFRPTPHIINWTMTYRTDADVWHPYGTFDKLEKPAEVDFEAIWNMKNATKTVTWLASNCNARNMRKQIIEKIISSGVEADLFGNCGKPAPKCKGVHLQSDDCVVQLIKPYKFYFAFENSNCPDYVTEKFYETLGTRMAVPIVLKRSFYEKVGAPSNSFIAVDDFKTIEELAKYINTVKDDKAKYLQYHQWRKEYRVLPEKNQKTGFCGLCTKLRTGGNWEPKSYEDLEEWHGQDKCENQYGANLL